MIMRLCSSNVEGPWGAPMTEEESSQSEEADASGALEDRLEEINNVLKTELKKIQDECAKALKDATELMQDVMPVEFKRLF